MPYSISTALDDPIVADRFESFRGGADEFSKATLLGPEVCQLLENMVVADNGTVKKRPGSTSLGGVVAGANKIQGMVYFDTPSGVELIVTGKNRDIEKWDGAAWSTVGATILADAVLMAEMVQGADKVYISDGTNQWRSYDGTVLSAALGNVTGATGDPPVGATIMCWHTRRMFASGVASAYDTIWASDFFDATTGKWNHTTNSFKVGYGEGEPITAMISMQDFWLGVFKSNSIYMVKTSPYGASGVGVAPSASTPTANDWQIETLSRNVGCVGKRALCRFGDDVLFLARDGIRSLKRMAAREGSFEVTPPLSIQMQPYIDRINWSNAHKSVAWKYQQYAFFALPLDSASEPNYVLVWNGRLESWMGVWLGWTPTCFATSMFAGQQRFVIGDTGGRVNEWLDYTAEGLDSTYLDNGGNIVAKMRTRATWFGEPASRKDGSYLEVRFIASRGNASVRVYYDEVQRQSWTEAVSLVGVTLPVLLPFFLPYLSPKTVRKSLNHLGKWNEAFIEVESPANRMELKNATIVGYIDAVQNDES